MDRRRTTDRRRTDDGRQMDDGLTTGEQWTDKEKTIEIIVKIIINGLDFIQQQSCHVDL